MLCMEWGVQISVYDEFSISYLTFSDESPLSLFVLPNWIHQAATSRLQKKVPNASHQTLRPYDR